jgi:uncharacterized protein YfaP (DUF2135 family)
MQSMFHFNIGKDDSLEKQEAMRAIAYSMDVLIPGLYVWWGSFVLRIGGTTPDDQFDRYPGEIHSNSGIALILPRYLIFTTYQGSYDPREA